MTVERIYRAYIEAAKGRQDPELEAAMDQVLDNLRTAGVDTMQAEEQINALLNRQEAMAFQAGFSEALDMCCQAAAMVQR